VLLIYSADGTPPWLMRSARECKVGGLIGGSGHVPANPVSVPPFEDRWRPCSETEMQCLAISPGVAVHAILSPPREALSCVQATRVFVAQPVAVRADRDSGRGQNSGYSKRSLRHGRSP
jgi:hypothetical protein